LSATIQIPQFLQHLTEHKKTVRVNGNTVRNCLKDLVRQYPELRTLVFTRNGRLLHTLDIFINGVSAYPGEMAKPVRDGDLLQIVNIVIGG
jgi:hypothetical protein